MTLITRSPALTPVLLLSAAPVTVASPKPAEQAIGVEKYAVTVLDPGIWTDQIGVSVPAAGVVALLKNFTNSTVLAVVLLILYPYKLPELDLIFVLLAEPAETK